MGFNTGPPFQPGGYNNNVQIVQTRDYVVLLLEMNHDARIIPMNNRPRLPGSMRTWFGDSRGRWEGTTLVVETTNFTPKLASFGARRGAAGYEIGTAENLRPRRTVHPRRRQDAAVRVHRERPEHVHAAVHGEVSDDLERPADLRGRLSRRELRADKHHARRPVRRQGRVGSAIETGGGSVRRRRADGGFVSSEPTAPLSGRCEPRRDIRRSADSGIRTRPRVSGALRPKTPPVPNAYCHQPKLVFGASSSNSPIQSSEFRACVTVQDTFISVPAATKVAPGVNVTTVYVKPVADLAV